MSKSARSKTQHLDRPTDGEWKFHPDYGRRILNENGVYVATAHRGKKAKHNGPILAAAKDAVFAAALLADAAEKMRAGEEVDDLDKRIEAANAAIRKAKGETQ